MEFKMIKERSFRARWGEPLKKYGHTQVSNVFLDNYSKLGISNQEAIFIIHCFKYKWTVDHPFPAFTTIAKKMSKDRITVQRYARNLEKKGFIIRIYQNGIPSKINLTPLIKTLEKCILFKNE